MEIKVTACRGEREERMIEGKRNDKRGKGRGRNCMIRG